MSDDPMRGAYQAAGALDRYHITTTPCDLWRGLTKRQQKSERDAAGAEGRDVDYRAAAMVAREDDSPELHRTSGEVVGIAKGTDIPVIDRGGKKIVPGCRTMRGEGAHWGLSFFDGIPRFADSGWKHFKLPAGADIPEGLAVTKDATSTTRANHYSLAPRADMPLELYQASLKVLEAKMETWVYRR